MEPIIIDYQYATLLLILIRKLFHFIGLNEHLLRIFIAQVMVPLHFKKIAVVSAGSQSGRYQI